MLQLFGRVELRDSGQALSPSSPEESEQLALYRLGNERLGYQETLFLVPILERLINRPDLGVNGVVDHLADRRVVVADQLPVIRVGVERAWAGDWVGALHILVPQLEDVLRSVLRRLGRETLRAHRRISGITEEIALAQVMAELSAAGVPDGIVFMLDLVFHLYGRNLRNHVGHGFAREGDCTAGNVARILQLYILVSEIPLTVTPADSEPASDP